MNDFKQLRVRSEVYDQLDVRKKTGQSFSAYIQIMLNYFQVTNIAPESCQTSPTAELKHDVERIVRILKAFEKTYLVNIKEISSFISKGKEEYLHEHAKEIVDSYVGDGLTTEQLNEFLGQYHAEKSKNERLNSLIEEQKKEIIKMKKSTVSMPDYKKDEMIDILDMLSEQAKEEGLNIVISKSVFDNAVKDFRKLIK